MSWEAWGSGPEPVDVDQMYKRGWESDANCDVWWKAGEPGKTYTFQAAVQAFVGSFFVVNLGRVSSPWSAAVFLMIDQGVARREGLAHPPRMPPDPSAPAPELWR